MSEQLCLAIEAGQPLLCFSCLRPGKEAARLPITREGGNRKNEMFDQSLKQFFLFASESIFDLEKHILNTIRYPELDTGRGKGH